MSALRPPGLPMTLSPGRQGIERVAEGARVG